MPWGYENNYTSQKPRVLIKVGLTTPYANTGSSSIYCRLLDMEYPS